MSALSTDALKHQTIKCYLSGIRHAQIALGHGDPFANQSMPRLEYVLKGIKRSQAEKNAQSKPRLPITVDLLRKMFKVWKDSNDPDAAMLPAACNLGFFGFLRAAEFTTPSQGPLFLHKDGQPLSRSSLVRKVRSALTQAGVDASTCSGHSFRIGAASTAAAKAVEDAIIQILGRWQSTAYLRYVKLPREQLASIAQVLAS